MTRWLKFWWPLALLSLVPVMANFALNRFEVSAADLVVPSVLNLLMSAMVAGSLYRVWRRDPVTGYTAGLLLALVLSDHYDDRLVSVLPAFSAAIPLPNLGLWSEILADLLLLTVLGLAAYWAGRGLSAGVRRLRVKPGEVAAGLVVTAAATFVLQAVPLFVTLVTEWPQFSYRPPQITGAKAAAPTAAKPDIYYIVLDRYASNDVLKQQFSFDNRDFTDYLQENEYFVNPSSQTNYPYTAMSVASTMSADYLGDTIAKFGGSSKQTTVPFDQTVRNSPVAQYLKQAGYRYDLVGNWYETSNQSSLADATYQETGKLTVLGQTVRLNNFVKNALTQSPLWRFLKPGLSLGSFKVFEYTNMSDVDMTRYALDQLRSLATQPAGGRFIFAHILLPHDPYYFNADGSLATDSNVDNVGRPVKQKYLDQVSYVNGQMKDILSTINRRSQEQAVVVLQSDEGPYPHQLNDEEFDYQKSSGELLSGDMRKWSDLNLQMKYGNLAAYHLPGADTAAKTEAGDSVNVFRLVLNQYFDAGLAYLPDCHYAYPDGRNEPMRFADITARLTGQPADGRCGPDGRLKSP